MDDALILFARRLQLGRVKTRLASVIGEQQALEVYRQLVEQANLLRGCGGWRTVWALTGEGDWEWEGEFWEQVEGDLGVRMESAMNRAFAEGAKRVVLAGTDIPGLSHVQVHDVFQRLTEGAEMATIPVEDGGYGAVGLNSPPGGLFLGQLWSHSQVQLDAVIRAASRRMRFSALPCLYDVDDWNDWQRWLNQQT